jgi:hypothetical protein
MQIGEIIQKLQKSRDDFVRICEKINDNDFFHQPADKWSIAQNVDHLVISANKTRLAYIFPKFMIRMYGGRPNRPSRNYDELVNRYKQKLAAGGKASGVFIPKSIHPGTGKENLLNDFIKSMDRLITAVSKNWKDGQLDQYLAPHPLLGKLTLRELCYFTVYHNYHHLHIIEQRVQLPKPI